MTDTLDWVLWMRSVWEARGTLSQWGEPSTGMDALEFLNLWLTDLLHVGRSYEAD